MKFYQYLKENSLSCRAEIWSIITTEFNLPYNPDTEIIRWICNEDSRVNDVCFYCYGSIAIFPKCEDVFECETYRIVKLTNAMVKEEYLRHEHKLMLQKVSLKEELRIRGLDSPEKIYGMGDLIHNRNDKYQVYSLNLNLLKAEDGGWIGSARHIHNYLITKIDYNYKYEDTFYYRIIEGGNHTYSYDWGFKYNRVQKFVDIDTLKSYHEGYITNEGLNYFKIESSSLETCFDRAKLILKRLNEEKKWTVLTEGKRLLQFIKNNDKRNYKYDDKEVYVIGAEFKDGLFLNIRYVNEERNEWVNFLDGHLFRINDTEGELKDSNLWRNNFKAELKSLEK